MKFISLVISFILLFSFPVIGEKENYDLLIISPGKFLNEVEKFAEFKEENGIKTIVVKLDDIYKGRYFTCYGRDDAEKIKYFVKNAYDRWHIKYLLLIGSAKFLPARYSYLNDRSSTWEYERKFISDLYYADLYDSNGSFSSWDTNNNGYYGEFEHEINGKKYTDEVDLYPEISVARIPCRNNIELRNAISKIMNYKPNNRMLLVGGDSYPNDPSGNIPEGIYLENKIEEEMSNYESIKLHPPEDSWEISKCINDGVSIAVFEGAGAHHLWATHEYDNERWIYYYGWNIRLLSNSIYPIVFTSGARLAKFDEKRECFNWIWISSPHGGVASIGSTGLCWMGHGKNVTRIYLGNLHLRFFKYYKNSSCLGDAWKNAIISYLNAFKWNGKVEKAFHMKAAEEFEVFGDPTLPLHASIAKKSNILHVGGDGNNNYTTIQDAVNDAMPGDIIVVHPGIYRENVTVNKKLQIIGENATLYGSFTILSSSIISGFEIFSPLYSIKCLAPHSLIENNVMHAYYGVLAENSTYIRIKNNTFKSRYGVYIRNSSYSKFYGNLFTATWYGIWIEFSDFVEIYDNNFSSNRWYTVWMDGCKDGIIDDNFFYYNWYSIFLYHSDNFLIERNKIIHNEHGPQIVFSCNNKFIRNDVEKNEHYGLYVDNNSENNRFIENNFIDNAFNARDDGRNIWDKNYWSDYIGNKFRILALIGVPKYIPKLSFDWHPSTHPY